MNRTMAGAFRMASGDSRIAGGSAGRSAGFDRKPSRRGGVTDGFGGTKEGRARRVAGTGQNATGFDRSSPRISN
jgi:hypothetical protein